MLEKLSLLECASQCKTLLSSYKLVLKGLHGTVRVDRR